MRLFFLFLLLTLSARAQTADSVHTERTIEPAVVQPNDTSERGQTERSLLKQLFRSSRKETTMFQLGVNSPSDFMFIGNRTLRNRFTYGGFWAGINHKIAPSIGLRGGASWSPGWFANTKTYRTSGASWMGQVAVDYYPFIQKRIRSGKTANNFYNNPYITLETWRPIVGTTKTEQPTGITYEQVPFQQSLALGIGLISTRTRFYYYSISFTTAYWFDRPAEVRHAVQPMLSYLVGFDF